MPPARRRPTQQRSRDTVDRIVSSGARVLADVGYQAASTNRIAAAACVSPGTLYQYFVDKDEIVAAVIERVVDGFGDGVAPALRTAATLAPRDAARLVLDAVLAELESRAALLEAFVDRVPADRSAERMGILRARVTDITFQLVAAQRPGLAQSDLERIAWMVVGITEHLAIRFVLDRPATDREAFLDELTRVLVSLAFDGPVPATGRPAPG